MRIELNSISKRYPRERKYAVRNINLSIAPGETVGLFGKSGCGKSTIGHILVGLLRPTEGTVLADGRILTCPYKQPFRRKIQIIFQHPEVSFDPKRTLKDSLREPYTFYPELFREGFSMDSLCEFLDSYGIYPEHLERRPAQLSGGELQRMALARIMLLQPEVIVLDEPTAMLDSISQAQVIRMLEHIQQEHKTAYLFTSHNATLCKLFCDKVIPLEDKIWNPDE